MIFWRFFHYKISKMKIKWLFISILGLILTSSIVIHLIEPETFPSVFKGLWWTIVTLGTVGYGDYFPKTTLGIIWGMFIITVGIGLFTLSVSKVFELIAEKKQNRREGKVEYKGSGHYVVIGWSGSARQAVRKILNSEPNAEVVLIDDKIDTIPWEKERFIFIKGFPSKDKTLQRANISQAKRIMIFAEEKLKIESPYDADARSSFIVTSVERIAGHVHTVVELCLEENKANFMHVDKNLVYQLSDQSFAEKMLES